MLPPNLILHSLEYIAMRKNLIFSEIFTILYPLLEYDLFTINVYSYDKKEQSVFFDIRDIILSPIFQNKILTKYNAQDIILFKKC